MKKVSFVCTTFRRFNCVRRIVAQFQAQTYNDKELIIFNTDEEYPYELGIDDNRIIIVNNGIDYITKQPYTNRGDICRDAVTHATGDYFMLADDDDIYLPYHLQQAVDGIIDIGHDAWKPQKSFFATSDKLELTQNIMEASVIVKMNRIREIGFRNDATGYEGLSWYTILRDERQLDEDNTKFIPSYCFNWGDPSEMAGHKQSGNIDDPNNFEQHKIQSNDIVTDKLTPINIIELNYVYQPYYNFVNNNKNILNLEQWDKYMINQIDRTQIELSNNVVHHPFHYRGLRTEQSINVFNALDALYNYMDNKPLQIIEIGSRNGGFTTILDEHNLSNTAKLYTIDIDGFNPNAKFSDNVTQIKADCFAIESVIGNIISQPGVTLVFCDGGDKIREINTFAKYLKPGDMIFGHDYAKDSETFNNTYRGKIWDWHELWDSAIEHTAIEYNLSPILPNDFDNAVWKSLIKNI
jgi:hypothetical protein